MTTKAVMMKVLGFNRRPRTDNGHGPQAPQLTGEARIKKMPWATPGLKNFIFMVNLSFIFRAANAA